MKKVIVINLMPFCYPSSNRFIRFIKRVIVGVVYVVTSTHYKSRVDLQLMAV